MKPESPTSTLPKENGRRYNASTASVSPEEWTRRKWKVSAAKTTIRLLVDAAHPFASQLHRTVDETSRTLHLPVIRFERKYPPRTENIIWCEDYADAIYRLEKAGTDRLLALTGVQTIGKLRPYWEKHTCWFRVLERETSITLAQEQGFPKGNLVFYHAGESESLLIDKLHPQAILTKESGRIRGIS